MPIGDTRVRIRIYHADDSGDWSYFVSLNERNRPLVEADHGSVHAALMNRDAAYSWRQKLRGLGWQCDIVSLTGDVLFADTLPKKDLVSEERVPWVIDGILFRPASEDRWCVRFPNHLNRETMYGATKEEVLEKLREFHLIDIAEKYVAPTPAPTEPTNTNALPDGVRYRPGSGPR